MRDKILFYFFNDLFPGCFRCFRTVICFYLIWCLMLQNEFLNKVLMRETLIIKKYCIFHVEFWSLLLNIASLAKACKIIPLQVIICLWRKNLQNKIIKIFFQLFFFFTLKHWFIFRFFFLNWICTIVKNKQNI